MDLNRYPALVAFMKKCGVADPFAEERFCGYLPKPVAMARVAVWSAISDKYRLTHAFTAGQITTIVDAAPVIVGKPRMDELDKVTNIEGVASIVDAHHKSWWKGISAAAQWWSLRMAVGSNDLTSSMRNSGIEDHEAAALALTAWHQEAGHIHPDMGNARTSEYSIEALVARIRHGARVLAERPDKRASTIMDMTWNGKIEWVAGLMDVADFEREHIPSNLPVEPKKENVGLYAFVGPRSITDYESLSLGNNSRGANESLEGFLQRTPMGSFVAIQASKWLKSLPDSEADGIYAAALTGYQQALEFYSPIITPNVSITDVARVAKMEQLEAAKSCGGVQMDLGIVPAAEPKSRSQIVEQLLGELEPYVASRFAAFAADTWMFKALQMESKSAHLIVNEEAVALRKRLETLAMQYEANGLSREKALKLASSDLLVIEREEAGADVTAAEDHYLASLIEGAEESLRRGQRVSLDAKVGDGETEAYNFYPEDMRQDLSEFDPEASPYYAEPEPAVPFAVGEMDPDRDGHVVSFASRYQKLHDTLAKKGKNRGVQVLAGLAKAQTPTVERLRQAIDDIRETFGVTEATTAYVRMLRVAVAHVYRGKKLNVLSDGASDMFKGVGESIVENVYKTAVTTREKSSGGDGVGK
jgi:hypothetical protein